MTQHRKRSASGILFLFSILVISQSQAFAQQRPAPRAQPARVPPPTAAATPSAQSQPRFKGIWEAVNYGEDLTLTDVFFVTAEVGWVSGAGGTILHTKDGGASWTAQLGGDPQSREGPIDHLQFVDGTHGWAVQTVGAYTYQMLQTSDGEHWEKIGVPRGGLTNFAFTSNTNGSALTPGGVTSSNAFLQTQDGGRTWKEVPRPATRMVIDGLTRNVNYNVLDFHFASPAVGYVVGGNRDIRQRIFVYKTEDGGNNWTLQVAEGPDFETGLGLGGAELFFIDDKIGYVNVINGLFSTADGGETWRGVAGFGGGELKFADPEVGWAFNRATFSWTTDGGKRWSSRQISFPAAVGAFSLPRRDRAYVVGDHGMIYRYRVVPVTETVAKAIDAPAMPTLDTALDEQVEQIEEQVEALEQEIREAQQNPSVAAGGAAATGPAEAGAGNAEGAGVIEVCCNDEIKQLETTVEGFTAEIPKFTSKYRNLNLMLAGIRLVGQLFGESQGVKDSLTALKNARDFQSASKLLTDLSNYVDATAKSTKAALQRPE